MIVALLMELATPFFDLTDPFYVEAADPMDKRGLLFSEAL
jgi:hypothetical protein